MSGRVTCPQCGKGYGWKPQYAGRKVKCACGEVFQLNQPEPTGAYSLVAEPPAPPTAAPNQGKRTCPSCASFLTDKAVICVSCGLNLITGKKVQLAVDDEAPVTDLDHRRQRDRQHRDRSYILEEFGIPLSLLIGGLIVQAGLVTLSAGGSTVEQAATALGALVFLAILMCLGTFLMLIGCFIAAKLIGIGFGSLPTALLKLAAIYVASSTASLLWASLLGTFLFSHLLLFAAVAAGLMSWLFELDMEETSITLGITFVIYLGVQVVVAGMVAGLVF